MPARTVGRLLALDQGIAGVRDLGLLESALARPRQHQSYAKERDLVELAAILTAGIIRNHPFVDGNKRLGFLCGVLFLELDGFHFTAPETEATHAVFQLAAGKLDEAAYASWFRANVRS